MQLGTYATLELETRGAALIVTINRPEALRLVNFGSVAP